MTRSKILFYLIALTLIALFTSCTTGNLLPVPDNYELSETKEMEVYGNRSWQQGNYKLKKGDFVKIKANGYWYAVVGGGGPKGDMFNTILGWTIPPFQLFFLGLLPKTTAPGFALVALLNKGNTIAVGYEYCINNLDGYYTGPIYFQSNIALGQSGLVGFMGVSMEIYRPKSLFSASSLFSSPTLFSPFWPSSIDVVAHPTNKNRLVTIMSADTIALQNMGSFSFYFLFSKLRFHIFLSLELVNIVGCFAFPRTFSVSSGMDELI